MSMDENPDEVFDNEPEAEAEMEENGDEQSNRSFRMMMIGLFAFGGLGVLLIALILIGRQGERTAIDAQNQMVQATNTAIAMLAQVTPVPPKPTETIPPTNTATPALKDLVDTALAAGNFTTLSSLLKTAGLTATLKGQGPFTIFAPTDDAFAQLSPASLEALKQDPAKLEALLKYHVVQGALTAANVAKSNEAKTLEGQPVTITVKDGKTQINDATLTKPDLETANGMIHTIDRVLVPPELSSEVIVSAPPVSTDLVDTALAAGNFNTLSSLLKTAGLTDTLKGQGPFTIFAPTDDAFEQLSPASLEALKKDPEKLEALLKYHVVEGAITSADVANSSEPRTLAGEPVTITVKDDQTQINDATLTRPGLETANGVIYTIDRVLVPPELSKEVVVVVPPTPKPGATQAAAGKGTAVAQVQGTTVSATVVPTRMPPQAATATAAASKGVTSTQPISGTAGTGQTGLPATGASDNLFVLLLAAAGLVGVLVVARRLRTSQS
jgi:transforming growth factor-beta-induced protein